MSWWHLLKSQYRFLFFGFLFAFASNFGQTFYISLYILPVAETFAVTSATFANYYGLLTLASAFLLPSVGKLIDRTDLLKYALVASFLLFLGTLTMALSSHFLVFILGLFFVRFAGQGLISHVSSTSMARFFQQQRGKALAISTMGFPIGEALLPFITVILIAQIGWRGSYLLAGVLTFFILTPLAFSFVARTPAFRRTLPEAQQVNSAQKAPLKPLGLSEYLRLSLLFPSYVAPPMLMTGLFFHQTYLAQTINVPITYFASGFVLFAVVQVSFTFFVGSLIDRFSAKAVYPFYLLPMCLALFILAYDGQSMTVLVYMALLGATAGMGGTLRTALIAEIFPPQKIGRYKSLGASAMIFSTAIGPAFYAQLMAIEFSTKQLLILSASLSCLAMLMALIYLYLVRRK